MNGIKKTDRKNVENGISKVSGHTQPHVLSIHTLHLYMNSVCRNCINSTFDLFYTYLSHEHRTIQNEQVSSIFDPIFKLARKCVELEIIYIN